MPPSPYWAVFSGLQGNSNPKPIRTKLRGRGLPRGHKHDCWKKLLGGLVRGRQEAWKAHDCVPHQSLVGCTRTKRDVVWGIEWETWRDLMKVTASCRNRKELIDSFLACQYRGGELEAPKNFMTLSSMDTPMVKVISCRTHVGHKSETRNWQVTRNLYFECNLWKLLNVSVSWHGMSMLACSCSWNIANNHILNSCPTSRWTTSCVL